MRLGRPASQNLVSFLGDVFHLNGGHGAIMVLHNATCNHTARVWSMTVTRLSSTAGRSDCPSDVAGCAQPGRASLRGLCRVKAIRPIL